MGANLMVNPLSRRKRGKSMRSVTLAQRADELVQRIGPIMHGEGPEVQGAVLIELLAIYLAGYVGPNITEIREQQIAIMLAAVRELVSLYDAKKKQNIELNK
jgi:hypothetical protein